MNSVLGDRKTVVVLLTPALFLYTLVKILPVLWSLRLSLYQGNTLRGFEFVGFANFVQFFNDAAARKALRLTVVYSVIATATQVALGYLLALLYVFVLRKGSALLRTVVFFPMVLPAVAVALLFRSLVAVGPNQGPVNELLNLLGFDSVEFLAYGDLTIATALVMNLWSSMGFYAVLLYTGLLDIPDEVIESARIDGASGVRLVRHIVLPLSLPILMSSIIFSFNATLKVFDGLLALNNGGPGSESSPLTLYMYRTAFEYAEYGYGSTIALVLTMLCLVFTLAIFKSSQRRVN